MIRNLIIFHVCLSALSCQTTKKSQIVKGADGNEYSHDIGDKKAILPHGEGKGLKSSLQSIKEQYHKNPNSVVIITSMAQHYLALGDIKNAEIFAHKALSLDFRIRDTKIVLAHTAYLQGRDKMAEAIVMALGGESAPEGEVLNLFGCLKKQNGDMEGALRLFEAALSKNPDNVAAMMNLGIMQLNRQNVTDAQNKFKEALKRLPDNPDIKLHLAVTYAMSGAYIDAQNLYDQVALVNKNSPILIFNQAVLKKRMGNYNGALASLKHYLKMTQGQEVSVEAINAIVVEIRKHKAGEEKLLSDEEIAELARRPTKKHPRANQEEASSGYVMSEVGPIGGGGF